MKGLMRAEVPLRHWGCPLAAQHWRARPRHSSCLHGSATSVPNDGTLASTPDQLREQAFHEAYAKAYTMSQLYVADRPAAIPVTELEQRRKKKDMQEIIEAARRRGKSEADVRRNLEELESILPGLVNLDRMPAKDWVAMSEDVPGVAQKIITLRTIWAGADVFRIVAARPRTLMQPLQSIIANAQQVKAMLAGAANVDAIIEAVPELSDAPALSRSLAFLRSTFPGHDPIEMLQENPQLMLNLGESNAEADPSYGEMTTKD